MSEEEKYWASANKAVKYIFDICEQLDQLKLRIKKMEQELKILKAEKND